MSPIETLRLLLSSGDFHHATYRCLGTVWEGLWVYRKRADGFRGYDVATCISSQSPDLEEAYQLCQGTGISIRSHRII